MNRRLPLILKPSDLLLSSLARRPKPRRRRRTRAQGGGQLSALLGPALKFIAPLIAGEALKFGIGKALGRKKGKGLHLAGQRGRGVGRPKKVGRPKRQGGGRRKQVGRRRKPKPTTIVLRL